MTAEAPGRTRVKIVSGRFSGSFALLVARGERLSTVDLGVPVDGGSGVVVVPTEALHQVE